MAPRGKKTEPETKTAQTAAGAAQVSAEAGDLASAAAEAGAAQDLGLGDDSLTDLLQSSGADVEEAPVIPHPLEMILAGANAKNPDPKVAAPEKRWFLVTDPVSLDGEDYALGDTIALTFNLHADLFKAQAVNQTWSAGDVVF